MSAIERLSDERIDALTQELRGGDVLDLSRAESEALLATARRERQQAEEIETLGRRGLDAMRVAEGLSLELIDARTREPRALAIEEAARALKELLEYLQCYVNGRTHHKWSVNTYRATELIDSHLAALTAALAIPSGEKETHSWEDANG